MEPRRASQGLRWKWELAGATAPAFPGPAPEASCDRGCSVSDRGLRVSGFQGLRRVCVGSRVSGFRV